MLRSDDILRSVALRFFLMLYEQGVKALCHVASSCCSFMLIVLPRESCGIVQGTKLRYVLASFFLDQIVAGVAAWLRLI